MSRLEQVQAMLERDPDDAFLNFSMGMELKAADQLDEAAGQFDRVIALDPTYLAAYMRKGEVLTAQQRFDDARAVLEQGLHIADKRGEAHMSDNINEMLHMLP